MGSEEISKHLLSISYDPDSDWENQWDSSVSGRIYKRLLAISKRDGKKFSLKNKGGLVEMYHLGEESARLVKHLENASVGETDGYMRSYIEGWEYKRFPWWKEALDNEGMPVKILPIPLARVAIDGGIDHWEDCFRPSKIMQKWPLKEPSNTHETAMRERWIKRKMIEVLDPLVAPDFHVADSDKVMRFAPISDRAAKSLIEDNACYAWLIEQVKKAAPVLNRLFDHFD